MGFHNVKDRGQKNLDDRMSIEDGFAEEARFFQNIDSWRSVEEMYLFGTKNLRVKLGELQMRLIHTSFEAIVSEIKTKREDAILDRSKLEDVPSELIERRAIFRRVKDEYCRTIYPLLRGGHIHGHHSSFKMKPSAEFHLASKQFIFKLTMSRLNNVSEVAVRTKMIALVDNKDIKDNKCYVMGENIYLPSVVEISIGAVQDNLKSNAVNGCF